MTTTSLLEMANVALYGGYSTVITGTPSPLPRPYLPSIPPKKTTKTSYSRFLLNAPLSALSDVVADARDPPKPPHLQRCQKRIQVGSTNRWRVPYHLGSDLLGSAQAIKAVSSSYNDTYMALRTADSPMTTCNYPELNGNPSGPYTAGGTLRSLLSPRFLRSQPAAATLGYDVTCRLIQTQPSHMHLRTKSPERGSDKFTIFQSCTLLKLSNSPRTSYREQKDDCLTLGQLQQIGYHRNIIPPSKRSPTPMEMFLYRSQTVNNFKAPDVVIHALDHVWEIHKPYLQKSWFLSGLVRKAEMEGVNNIIDEEEEAETMTCAGPMDLDALKTAAIGVTKGTSGVNLDLPHNSSSSLHPRTMTFKLRIKDPLITRQAFAQALGSLYETESDIRVDEADVVGVLAAAHFLGFAALEKVCTNVMLGSIAAWSVCAYHAASKKYRQNAVMEVCERWLEVNLVPQLSVQIYLSHLPQDILEKTLKSTRVFTWSEYSMYKLLSYWIFLQQHPNLQLMPSWGTVVTWFMSFPKTSSFLEQEEGHGYVSLFRTIRLEGITESSQLDELHKMNIVPQSWLLNIYSQHYHALQGGGDMSLMTRFEQGAVRLGFLIEQELRFHSEIISLHGFHFEVKVTAKDSGYSFVLQRLRPNDPVLSFRASERHTFSMRSDREVRYSFRIQWVSGDMYKMFTTGVQSQSFSFSGKNQRSEPCSVRDAVLPIYVTVSLMFPPS